MKTTHESLRQNQSVVRWTSCLGSPYSEGSRESRSGKVIELLLAWPRIILGSNVAPTPPEFQDVPAIEISLVDHSVGSMVEVELAWVLLPSVRSSCRSRATSPWVVVADSPLI